MDRAQVGGRGASTGELRPVGRVATSLGASAGELGSGRRVRPGAEGRAVSSGTGRAVSSGTGMRTWGGELGADRAWGGRRRAPPGGPRTGQGHARPQQVTPHARADAGGASEQAASIHDSGGRERNPRSLTRHRGGGAGSPEPRYTLDVSPPVTGATLLPTLFLRRPERCWSSPLSPLPSPAREQSSVLTDDLSVTIFRSKVSEGEKIDEATAAGADIVGLHDLIEQIKGGFMECDKLIASAYMIPKVCHWNEFCLGHLWSISLFGN
ncbi:uncharacterized protein LOC124707831 [Lolium rigidum]|uniref:uncharacterized protein LOC124707831 n=1 Tax=Lolium rigidum TaxID=89674 RepID=UPI001F5DDC70|nr:uncharacterized protein LOC124707831 [Lolium rigidum]